MTDIKEYDEQILFDYSIVQPRINNALMLPEDTDIIQKDSFEELEEGLEFNFEFDQEISKADELDCKVAAASGLLTAILDILWVEEFSLTDAREWGSEEVENFVIEVAKKKAGFVPREDNKEVILQKAILKLEKAFPIPADILSSKFGDGYFHHFRDFVHHPTLLGLLFSILSQFTKCGFGTNTNGEFKIYPIPEEKLDEYLIGDTFEKKILYGTVNWAIHLISDLDGSSNNPGKGTGIPGPILSFFKEMSSLPLINEIQVKYEYRGNEKNIRISALLQKIFDGTLFADHDDEGRIIRGTEKPLDFRTELGIAKGFIKSTIPVIANECIIRAFFFIRRFCSEIKRNDVKTLSGITSLDPKKFLPYDNRALTRMLTISSGTFMVVVTAKDAVAAAIKSGGSKKKFAKYFFLNINYVGIVRFTFACKNDAGYIAEDVKKEYSEYVAEKRRKTVEKNKEIPGLKSLMLNEKQTRILYSLKWHIVNYDIEQTEDAEIAALKKKWLREWEQSIRIDFNEESSFIMKNERFLYANIKRSLQDGDSNAWLYLIAIELNLFKPYYLFDVNQVISKKAKYRSNYLKDVFCIKQDAVTETDLKHLQQEYAAAYSALTNKKAKTAIGATAAVAVTAATGGLALAFAPEIAVALVGGSFAGLSGAALTSASLAAVGFGSIAAGGLGMAGGTAIIAGGGTLLGVVGSGAMTLSAKAFLSSKGAVLIECAKLLTFCRGVMMYKYCDSENVVKIQGTVESNLRAIEQAIDNSVISDGDDVKRQKKMLDEAKASMKYIKRCDDLLIQTLNDKDWQILSKTVYVLRQENPCGMIWERFEYKGDYIFIVSDGTPKEMADFAPNSKWYAVNKKTGEISNFEKNWFDIKEVEKISKAREKTMVLMDITHSQYKW